MLLMKRAVMSNEARGFCQTSKHKNNKQAKKGGIKYLEGWHHVLEDN